ncbi:metalloregulator ArsR/SmtB family transcription factor [Bacillus sp. BB56-3]|uniref:ArsR/SmtB family transcription factor n=1 Tax=Bacillus sp. BB56-3 TaxID=2217831 RepID=UPI0011EF5E92|nr:metalloregulator ArsR/SmtB family transcription factor [Bacillus sp. BB56-3]KAA0781510.1 transcriptional regulator [Bacillus sp. BB56-3]
MTHEFYRESDNYERVSEIFKVLAHPVRLQIIRQLLETQTLNVSNLQKSLNLPQSTVSQHLTKLKQHKIVTHNRKGLEVFYRVEDIQVQQTMGILIF